MKKWKLNNKNNSLQFNNKKRNNLLYKIENNFIEINKNFNF